MQRAAISKGRVCDAWRRAALCLALCLACLWAPLQASAQGADATADSVKAAFLYHFAGYVEWPQAEGDAPVTIGVMGSQAVADELRRLLPGRRINGRPVHVRTLSPGDRLSGLHVIYIGEHEREQTRQIIDAVSGAPTLTVSDSIDGLERGAMINFVLVEDRVRFEISQGAAKRAGLKLSSRLLAVALRVRSSGVPTRRNPLATGLYSVLRA